MFRLISKHLRKKRMLFCLWQIYFFVYLFMCSLHVFTINVIICKMIAKTKGLVWMFYYSNCHEKLEGNLLQDVKPIYWNKTLFKIDIQLTLVMLNKLRCHAHF